jgi:hypothetical protein
MKESPRFDEHAPKLSDAVRTLVGGGFSLHSVTRKPGYALLLMRRQDEFGAIQNYAFAVCEDPLLTVAQVEAASISAKNDSARLVVVGHTEDKQGPSVEWDRFLNLFGGAIHSTAPLDPEFGANLITLGKNALPAGLVGRPDDLFEVFVQVGLEFILGGRVLRYGQDRRFEARPDGLALPSLAFRALYDAKAYKDGYPVTADSLRQFRSYVEEFERRYKAYLPRLKSFIVVSGDFDRGNAALQRRYEEFITDPGIPLSFLRAEALAGIIRMIADVPAIRSSINWGRVFARSVVDPSHVQEEIDAVRKDRIIPGL